MICTPKDNLIVGIDPGTTAALAILELSGTSYSILYVTSAKHISSSEMISIITKHGKPIVISTDKKKSPQTVERIARQTGAYLSTPIEDMKVADKRVAVSRTGFKVSNDHERDALAAAIAAVQRLRPMINTAHAYLKQQARTSDIGRALRYMLNAGESDIKAAVQKIDRENEPKRKNYPVKIVMKEDPAKLAERIVQLRDSLKEKERIIDEMRKALMKRKSDKIVVKTRRAPEKDRTIDLIRNENGELRRELLSTKSELLELVDIIAESSDFHVAPILKDLGANSFDHIKAKKYQQIIVHDTDIISSRTLAELSRREIVILTSAKAPKWSKDYPRIRFVDISKLKIKRIAGYGLIGKKQLKSALENENMLDKVVSDYKRQRNST